MYFVVGEVGGGECLYQGLSKHQEVCFTIVMKVEKNYCDFMGPSWCNIKVDPEKLVTFGSYKPLVSYVEHQIKVKKGFKIMFPLF